MTSPCSIARLYLRSAVVLHQGDGGGVGGVEIPMNVHLRLDLADKGGGGGADGCVQGA